MKKNTVVFTLLLSWLLAGCRPSRMVTVDYGTLSDTSQVLRLAVSDLRQCMRCVPASIGADAYVLKIDPAMPDGAFGYTTDSAGRLCFHSADEIGISHAVYTYLERLGYTFDLTGISAPVAWTAPAAVPDTLVQPAVRWRGIRQHVNFPMDISSYPIQEAREYIDQLVRMRYNKIVIHSYPGQWYETHIGDSLSLAGNYFYGNKHYLYDNALLKRVVEKNDSLFCIPGAEALRYDARANSHFALDWMKQLVDYAIRSGLYVQMSFEPRVASVEQAVQTAYDVLEQYPGIDALELITEETGGWGPHCTRQQTLATLNRYFPADIATDSTVTAPIRDSQTDLNALYEQIGQNAEAIRRMRSENGKRLPELKLGIYCSVTPYAEGAYRLARLALPDTKICLMSSHGSEGTAQALPAILKTPADLANTEIYSWIEFDGLMYLYQNSIGGNEKMMDWLNGKGCVPSILFNHWRTAENRTSARYASEVTLSGHLRADDFYASYAGRLAVPDAGKYAEALRLVNEADVFATRHLGNIGFCWMGAWGNGGSYTWMSRENIEHARELYYRAGNLLKEVLEQTGDGKPAHAYLSFLCNRLLCSVLYLDAFHEAVGIQQASKAGKPGSEEEKAYVREVCDRALLIFDQYMEKHAEMLVDRGCEGTLVSVWNAPVRGLKICRERMGGVPMDSPSSLDAVDAPPLPILY